MRLRALLHRNNASSANRFDAPITLCGFTALSVDTITNVVTSCIRALCANRYVPTALFSTAASGLLSMSGTCLKAAAWIMVSGFCASKYLCKQRAIADVSNNRAYDAPTCSDAQIKIDLVEIPFRVIQKNQAPGFLSDDRLGKSRADRTSRSGQQNAAIGEGDIHRKLAIATPLRWRTAKSANPTATFTDRPHDLGGRTTSIFALRWSQIMIQAWQRFPVCSQLHLQTERFQSRPFLVRREQTRQGQRGTAHCRR